MSFGANETRSPTSPAHDAFQLIFETADIVSLYWQPLFKSMGRWQLELGQAYAKQSRAAIEFGNSLTHATSPIDVVNAQTLYWKQVGQAYSDANQHITQAIARATETPAGIEILPAIKKRPHDTLRLDDGTPQRSYEPERKVA